jgi:transcriptional regulator with XRE-family HTH domain
MDHCLGVSKKVRAERVRTIKKYLKERRMSMASLARLAGVNKSTLSRILSKSVEPYGKTWDKIMAVVEAGKE